MAEVVEGLRGGLVLLHQDHKFRRNKTTNTFMYWNCSVKTSMCPLKTPVFDIRRGARINVLTQGTQNHPPDGSAERTKSLDTFKAAVREDVGRTPKRAYDMVSIFYHFRKTDKRMFSRMLKLLNRCHLQV